MSNFFKGRKVPYWNYFGIMGEQVITNFDYAYFLLMGVLLEIAVIRPYRLIHFIFLGTLNLVAGFAAITNVVSRVDKAFDTLGLKFHSDFGRPHWIVKGKYPLRTNTLHIHSAGYAAEDFRQFLPQIAARLNQSVKDIKKSPNSPILEVSLEKIDIPNLLKFDDLPLTELKQGEFFVGKGDDGLEKLHLSRMPHMLVAGQTGGGKTQFLKQFMATILTRTRYSKIHLIDMKGGIDFQGFHDAPNFEMSTTYDEGVQVIKKIHLLFELRRDYLLKKKKENWYQCSSKDLSQENEFNGLPLGPVLIVVDELAELVQDASASEGEEDLQDLISRLARLARMTGIHVCIGTQYPTRDIIRGDSKTNLPTRICFSVPDVSASTLVVGDMSATTIGRIPGRAVYVGPTRKIIQCPLLDNIELAEMITEFAEKQHLLPQTSSVPNIAKESTPAVEAPEIVK